MKSNDVPQVNGVANEIVRWRSVLKYLCSFLKDPFYQDPTTRCSSEMAPALKSLNVFENKDGERKLAARISIENYEYGLGGGFRWGPKDIVVEVYSDYLCEESLAEFAKWYRRTGKRARIVLFRPSYSTLSQFEMRTSTLPAS